MAYNHNVQLHRRRKRSKRVVHFLAFVIIAVLLTSGAIFVDWLISNFRSTVAVSTGSETTVQSARINVFRTPYFQFQTDKTWREVSEPNTNDKIYVYRSFDGPIVQHEITVTVDDKTVESLDNEQTTRVLPVEIVESRLRNIGEISDHCKELIPDKENREQQIVSYKNSSFPCNPDGSNFVVVAALLSGSEKIDYISAMGESHTIKITYRDSTFSPNGRPLNNIINTFQLL